MSGFDVTQALFRLIPMIFALTVHEFFHAWTASKLGDDTAVRQGRLTLNPLAHIDPIGTILLPMVGMLTGAPFFGWAKPVPISPLQFTRRLRMKTGVLLTSAAGPLSNLVFGFLLAVVIGVIALVVGEQELALQLQDTHDLVGALIRLLGWTTLINIGLFVFNLIPIPPLDGSGVLAGFLPDRYHYILEAMSQYSFILFILILWVGGSLISVPVLFILRLFVSLVGSPEVWVAIYRN